MAAPKCAPSFCTLVQACKELLPTAVGCNLRLKVLSVEVAVDHRRADGSRTRIAEAIVGDDSASIVFTGRDDQCDFLVPGDTVEVLNGKVEMYKGWMRLVVDRWGKIRKASQPATFKVATHNLSSVEYELVERGS